MNKNLLNIKKILICLCSVFFTLGIHAEGIDRYKKRVDQYQELWHSLMPTYTKFQYAGGMGLINAGFGWSYGKDKQWETDIYIGFIPRYNSDKSKLTMTLKQNYIPWRVSLSERWTLEPLATGLYFNTVFSDEFWTQEPDRYPRGYYISLPAFEHTFMSANDSLSIFPTRSAFSPEALQLSTKSALAIFMWSVLSPTI